MNRKIEIKHHQLSLNKALSQKNSDAIISASGDWGKYDEQFISLPQGSISSIAINIKDKRDELHVLGKQSAEYLQLCMLLKGGAVYHLEQITLGNMQERVNKFRLAFSQDENYKVVYQDAVDLIHISIKLDYYLNLLSDNELWSATLKEKILKNDLVFQRNTTTPLSMLQCARDIIQNPFDGNLRTIMIEAKLQELIGWQLSTYANRTESPIKINPKDQVVFYALREYLDKTYADAHSLSSLCKKFGLNNFKIKKGFKQLFSKTVFEYIVEKRLDAAYHFIVDTQMPVSEVSELTGYKNQAHFATVFKKHFGATPTTLRK